MNKEQPYWEQVRRLASQMVGWTRGIGKIPAVSKWRGAAKEIMWFLAQSQGYSRNVYEDALTLLAKELLCGDSQGSDL